MPDKLSSDLIYQMLKHSGMLEPQQPTIPIINNCTTTDLQWRTWLQREGGNRSVQVLSIVHRLGKLLTEYSDWYTTGS